MVEAFPKPHSGVLNAPLLVTSWLMVGTTVLVEFTPFKPPVRTIGDGAPVETPVAGDEGWAVVGSGVVVGGGEED